MDKINVTKFNGTDFGLWKYQMSVFLEYHGLYDIVSGREVRPQERYENWDTTDKKAKYALTQSLELSQIRHVINCRTSNEIWTRLEALYEQKNETSVHLLLARFFEYKMDPNKMTVSEHVSNVEQMARQLEDVGHKQDETTIITKILHSLPVSFRSVISAWDSVPRNEQRLANLLPRLMKEEQLAKSFGELKINSEDESVALCAKKSKHVKKPKQDKKTFKGKCFNCNEEGHTARQCKKPKQESKQANSASQEKRPSQGDAFTASSSSAFRERPNEDCWIADSGASNHMTFRREWFETFKAINDRTVPITVGNKNIVYARGKGNIKVISTVNGKEREGTLYDVLWIPDLGRNLLSIGASTKHENRTIIEENQIKIINKKNQTTMIGYSHERNLYTMDTQVVLAEREAHYAEKEAQPMSVWHERFGHVSYKKLEQMITSGIIKGENITKASGSSDKFCEACIFGKQTI